MNTQRKYRILEKLAEGTAFSPADMAVPADLAQQGVRAYTARRGAGWIEAAKAMGRPADWRTLQKQYGVLRAGDQFHADTTGGEFMRVRDGRSVMAPPRPTALAQAPAAALPQPQGAAAGAVRPVRAVGGGAQVYRPEELMADPSTALGYQAMREQAASPPQVNEGMGAARGRANLTRRADALEQLVAARQPRDPAETQVAAPAPPKVVTPPMASSGM